MFALKPHTIVKWVCSLCLVVCTHTHPHTHHCINDIQTTHLIQLVNRRVFFDASHVLVSLLYAYHQNCGHIKEPHHWCTYNNNLCIRKIPKWIPCNNHRIIDKSVNNMHLTTINVPWDFSHGKSLFFFIQSRYVMHIHLSVLINSGNIDSIWANVDNMKNNLPRLSQMLMKMILRIGTMDIWG